MNLDLEKIKEISVPIFKANNVEFAGVFGSFARGEQNQNSDIDILVKFTGPATFAGYLHLDENLRNKLNREVDLVTTGAVNKYLKPQIERDLVIFYGQRPNLSSRN